MVIIRLSGGLGNQMFEYALYLSMKARGKTVKIDDISDYQASDRRPRQLCVFDASYEKASREEVIELTDSSMDLFSRIRRKITGRKDLSYREKDMEYDSLVFEKDPVYLTGNFQSEAYFADIKDKVRNSFLFKNISVPEVYQKYQTAIDKTLSVSVHIRRGDYLDPSHQGIYEGICTCEYYEKAISFIQNRYPEACFYLFTNDVEWTKKNLSGTGRTIVEGGSEETGYLDMYLMSRCRHNIIANSSFSWWGAWLNTNPEKIVVAPSKWLNGRECRSIYTEDMIRI